MPIILLFSSNKKRFQSKSISDCVIVEYSAKQQQEQKRATQQEWTVIDAMRAIARPNIVHTQEGQACHLNMLQIIQKQTKHRSEQ